MYNALMLDSLTVGDMVEAVCYFCSFYNRILHCLGYYFLLIFLALGFQIAWETLLWFFAQ